MYFVVYFVCDVTMADQTTNMERLVVTAVVDALRSTLVVDHTVPAAAAGGPHGILYTVHS